MISTVTPLKQSLHPDAGLSFINFLFTSKARRIYRNCGFVPHPPG